MAQDYQRMGPLGGSPGSYASTPTLGPPVGMQPPWVNRPMEIGQEPRSGGSFRAPVPRHTTTVVRGLPPEAALRPAATEPALPRTNLSYRPEVGGAYLSDSVRPGSYRPPVVVSEVVTQAPPGS